MRCPSCGNENPDDYTFCDDCGAKLTPQGSEGATPGAVQDAMYAPTGGGEVSAPLVDMGGGTTGGGQAVAMSAQPSGGVCPSCGAATVPGEAYCNECGAELASASASAPASDGAPGTIEPYMGNASAAPASDSAPGNMEPYMGSANADDEPGGVSIGVPVTEDTMATQAQAQTQTQAPDMPQVETAQAASMPGIMPIEGMESMEDSGAAQAAAMEEPMPISMTMPAPMPGVMPEPASAGMGDASMASTGAPGLSTAAWATDALRQLEEGQQSMAKGDWVAYGQSMGALKAFLESIVKGTAPQVAGMDVSAAPRPHQSVVDDATAAEGRSGGTAVPVPMPGAVPASAMSSSTAAYPGTGAAIGTAAGLARLVVIATGAEMPLPQQEEITVGREDPSSGIFPDIDLTPYGGEDGGVSRRHARLLHLSGDYYVEDLQSTNYTKLDGQRLPARVREKLEDGARLDFGRVAMIFRKG